MPTYYRPTERHGKRVVYRSTDPGEPRRERQLVNIFLIGMFLFGLLIVAASHWR
jgi:hypothetical protein